MRFKESGATGILYVNQPVYSLYIRGAQSIMHHIRSNNNQYNIDFSNHSQSQSCS